MEADWCRAFVFYLSICNCLGLENIHVLWLVLVWASNCSAVGLEVALLYVAL
jgi:hypothetical protein